MKRQAALFFLVLLSLPAIYKAGLFSFYELNRDYIAKNYCVNKNQPITICYGKCFLQRGMELTDQTPNPESINAQLKMERVEFFVLDFEFASQLPEKILRFSISPTPSVSDGVFSSVFRPPLV